MCMRQRSCDGQPGEQNCMLGLIGVDDVMLMLRLYFVLCCLYDCDTAADNGNRVVSLEAIPELPSQADNDLVIGRASDKMILAELSAEEVLNSTAITVVTDEDFTENGKNLTADLSTEATPRRPQFEFMPQFEHSSYDFMVPEGSNPVSTVLAVISYLGRKDQPTPIFKISFDRMRWFELDNYIEYKVTINQRPDVYVQYSLTKNGSYKFSVEAHDAGTMHIANIRVDVISLSPTTRRSTTTPASTTPIVESTTTGTSRKILEFTTPLITTTKSVESTLEAEQSTENILRSSTVVDGGSAESSPLPSTTKTTAVEFTEISLEDQTLMSETGSKEATTSRGVDASSTEDPDFTLPTTTADISTTESPSTLLLQSMDDDIPVVRFGSASHSEKSTSESTTPEENLMFTTEVSNMKDEEGSGESTEFSTTAKDTEELKIVIEGTKEGEFKVKNSIGKGDMVRGLAVSILSNSKHNPFAKLSLEGSQAFDIRPKLLYSGSKAYLFARELPETNTPIVVTIIAEGENSLDTKTIKITTTSPPRGNTNDKDVSSSGERTVDIVEYNFSISENAPSGSTVGQIEDGSGKKVVGPPGLFSLLGSDLILSCPDEGSCLDYEAERTHHVLLIDAQGRASAPIHVKINVQDVNDNRPRLDASDNFIRLSNNKLIMPFLVQVVDADAATTNDNQLSLSGTAASFLALSKISENLYQINVVGFAPHGVHQLEISVSDEKSSDKIIVEVQVQNTRSHAHFRRQKYSRSITADKIHEGNQLLQVELEGVPIDEARFVILHGNPGWLSIDDYGGRVGIAKFIRNVQMGDYSVEIGAVDRQSNVLLAQTRLEIKVIGGAESEKKIFQQNFYEKTVDREESNRFSVPFKTFENYPVTVESTFAIDENGQQKEFGKEHIEIVGQEVVFRKSALTKLRAVSVELSSNGEKAYIMLSLTSSPEFIENQRQESSRPFFPHPWTRENNVIEISIAEELPAGHVVYSLPAINPMDGSLVPVTMQGDMERAFTFDPSTGAISIAHLLDFESMAPNDRTFSLTFKAGLDGYESMAELRITVTNVNDSPPMLEKEGVQNELAIPENLPPSTIIARLQIKDKDDPLNLENYVAEKSGHGSELYTVSVINGSFVVAVAENATLDREQLERQTVHLTVKDGAGNQDSATLSIRLLDVNDNAPRFSQDQYAMQVVDNWPPGIIVDRMRAIDADSGKNSHVIYSLSTENAKNFAIDAVTGELSIGRELAGVAREQPYELVVVAEDAGTPSLSSSVRIKLKVSEPLMDGDEKGQVYFINPSVEYTLKVKEDTPINEHIYNVKARMAGVGEERMNIKYSLKDTLNDVQYFDIDESSGEIYVTRALDYESTKYYSPPATALQILSIAQIAWYFIVVRMDGYEWD
ncbi:hypothetical protein RB195_000442 [Necator americanus]|uniref:Cadherin domain-containing protein n=1 Tax=Necator americanus TaxID=51031 RepID=A0ABR1DB01_NECAM